ncbi:MAG: 4-demethylwyosine synthase TYW1 [Candidatus Micrarchaeota archaeon]
MEREFGEKLESQGYHIKGGHFAVKRCKWLREALTKGRFCYKNTFYGIGSHRCMQCTPALQFCSHACVFCWRAQAKNGEMPPESYKWTEPGEMAEAMLWEQGRIASGYGGNEKVEKRMWEEAKKPKHVALSLSGEPTIYPHLSELIGEFHRREMSTFLVSNGTLPKALESLSNLPTQLYLSMVSPELESYEKICRPWIKGGWGRYEESLDFLKDAKTRTVLRMTLARELNFCKPEGYAKQIEKALPDYVEVKSFMFVGGSREPGRGLSLESMIKHGEIKEFAGKLSELTGYIVSEEHAPSRVVLLCRDEKALKKRLLVPVNQQRI